MKKTKKLPKTGKLYLFLLILSIFALFCANWLKSSHLGSQNLDTAPFSSENTLETLEKPEKPAEISSTFKGAVEAPTKSPSILNFSAPIINVSDMKYNNNTFYNTFGIMHHTSYTRFFYAHNTGAFKNLQNLHQGDIFILGGVKYQASIVTRYSYAETQTLMNSIASARLNGTQYDVSLMTCSGTRTSSLPNGGVTNTHRLIVYANRV